MCSKGVLKQPLKESSFGCLDQVQSSVGFFGRWMFFFRRSRSRLGVGFDNDLNYWMLDDILLKIIHKHINVTYIYIYVILL